MESVRLSPAPNDLEGLAAANLVTAQLATLAALQTQHEHLLVPEDDISDPEVSIVIPALNEEVTISEFVEWCKEGLAKAGVRGEILIVDSSTDGTAERAVAGGARVLKVPKRGLGRAYIDAIPFNSRQVRADGRRRSHLRLS